MDAVHLLRLAARYVESGSAEIVCCNIFEDAALSLILVKFGDRSRSGVAFRKPLNDSHDAISVRIGERFEQYGIDHGEDCRVGADAECQR